LRYLWTIRQGRHARRDSKPEKTVTATRSATNDEKLFTVRPNQECAGLRSVIYHAALNSFCDKFKKGMRNALLFSMDDNCWDFRVVFYRRIVAVCR
jgi:hypothetical protein